MNYEILRLFGGNWYKCWPCVSSGYYSFKSGVFPHLKAFPHTHGLFSIPPVNSSYVGLPGLSLLSSQLRKFINFSWGFFPSATDWKFSQGSKQGQQQSLCHVSPVSQGHYSLWPTVQQFENHYFIYFAQCFSCFREESNCGLLLPLCQSRNPSTGF